MSDGRGYETFEEWLRRVDAEVEAVCGLSHRDLADWNYYDAYESGTSPAEVARDVLEDEGFPFDE